MDENDMMVLVAKGDIKDFEQLYKNTYKKIFVFILSMTKCRQTAEDLMHDTYMRIFEKAGSYQIGTNVSTWIMTIARNIAYDYFRRTKNIIPIDESFAAIGYDESISVVEKDRDKNDPDHFRIDNSLLSLRNSLGKNKDSIELYKKRIVEYPDDTEEYVFLAQAYLYADQVQEAKKVMEAALEWKKIIKMLERHNIPQYLE